MSAKALCKAIPRILMVVVALNLMLSAIAHGQWHPSEGIFTNTVDWICSTPKGILAIRSPYEFRSTDDGKTWTYLPTSRTRSASFYQSGPVIYNIADSLFRSTDWGESWKFVSAWPGVVDKRHPLTQAHDTLFVSTLTGPYFSIDGGQNWAIVPYTTGGKVMMYSFDDAMIMIESGHSETILYRSLDGGKNWEHYETILSDDVPTDFVKHRGKLFATAFNGVYVSTDQAKTWLKLDVIGTNFVKLLDAGAVLYTLESGRIHRSLDTGATWASCSLPMGQFATTLAFDGSKLFCGSAGTGVWTSTNTGDAWTAPGSTGYTVKSIFETSDGLIGADDSLGFLRSRDFGQHWVREDPEGLPNIGSVRFGGSDTLIFAISDSDGIYRSTDAGHTWKLSYEGLKFQNQHVICDGLVNVFGKTFLFGPSMGFGPGLYRWDNDSLKWHLVNWTATNDILFVELKSIGNALVVAATSGPTLRSLDTGKTWLRDTLHWPTSIGLDGTIYNIVQDRFAMYGLGSEQAVYRSQDSGLTWTQFVIEPKPGYIPIVRGLFGTKGHLVAYEYDGLWSSSDGGATWVSISEGLVTPPLSMIESSGVLVASTWGYGQWWIGNPTSNVKVKRLPQAVSINISAAPQPASHILNVTYHCDDSPIREILLFDDIGRNVWSASDLSTEGQAGTVLINVAPFSSGVYHLIVRTTDSARSIAIMVSH